MSMDKDEIDHKLRFIEMLLIISTVLFAFRPNQFSILFFLSAICYYGLILLETDIPPFFAIITAFLFSLPFGISLADMTPNITPLYHSFLIISNSIAMTIVLSIILNENKIVYSSLYKLLKMFGWNLPKKKKR